MHVIWARSISRDEATEGLVAKLGRALGICVPSSREGLTPLVLDGSYEDGYKRTTLMLDRLDPEWSSRLSLEHKYARLR